MLIPLPEIVRSVTTENPWWETGAVPKRFDTMPRRAYFAPFKALVANPDINRAVILLGPRRVGKTVMTQHLIQSLIADGVPPKQIMYVSVDTPTYTGQNLQFFLDLHLQHQCKDAECQRYIIFDEVQYLPDWERHLKALVDRNPSVRFVASGSAAAALRLASTESGAGRFTEFVLPPLTFEEYLTFVGKAGLVNTDESSSGTGQFPDVLDIEELNREFINYVNYGGYPEAVVSEYIRMDAARFIKNDIIDKVLLRDLPQLYGITNIQELNRLFTSLAYQTGQEISLEALAQKSGGISKPTIARYLEYLEAAFLIFRVRRVDDTARTFKRDRTFKIYLTNPSMRAALFSPATEDSDSFGHLVETAIFGQWFHSGDISDIHYARWKRSGKAKAALGDHGEIDIVYLERDMLPSWFIEIKWSDRAFKRTESWGAIREFAAGKRTLKNGVYTSKTLFDSRRVNGVDVRIIPAALYCFVVGRNSARARGRELLRSAVETG